MVKDKVKISIEASKRVIQIHLLDLIASKIIDHFPEELSIILEIKGIDRGGD